MPNLLCHDCPVLAHVRMCLTNAVMSAQALHLDLQRHDARRGTWRQRLSRKWRAEERDKRAGIAEALRRSRDNAAYCTRLLELIEGDRP